MYLCIAFWVVLEPPQCSFSCTFRFAVYTCIAALALLSPNNIFPVKRNPPNPVNPTPPNPSILSVACGCCRQAFAVCSGMRVPRCMAPSVAGHLVFVCQTRFAIEFDVAQTLTSCFRRQRRRAGAEAEGRMTRRVQRNLSLGVLNLWLYYWPAFLLSNCFATCHQLYLSTDYKIPSTTVRNIPIIQFDERALFRMQKRQAGAEVGGKTVRQALDAGQGSEPIYLPHGHAATWVQASLRVPGFSRSQCTRGIGKRTRWWKSKPALRENQVQTRSNSEEVLTIYHLGGIEVSQEDAKASRPTNRTDTNP